MQTTWLTPKVAGTPTGNGMGLVATAPLAPEEPVVIWGGVLCTRAELSRFPALVSSNCVQIDVDTYLLQPYLTAGDRVNHSCAPSCGFAGDRALVTLRALSPGEEITYDYAMSDTSDYDEFVCTCGTPTCRKLINGNDWKDPTLRARYAGFMSSYIQALIRRETERAAAPGAAPTAP
jgi:hypothetical protein